MKTVGLDTSVVLRLLTGLPAAQASAAVSFLDELRKQDNHAVVSDLVVAEAYFALHYHYGVTKANALTAIRRMFDDGEIVSSGSAHTVLRAGNLASAKPGFVDRLIHEDYTTGTGMMATFERASRRLRSVTLLR